MGYVLQQEISARADLSGTGDGKIKMDICRAIEVVEVGIIAATIYDVGVTAIIAVDHVTGGDAPGAATEIATMTTGTTDVAAGKALAKRITPREMLPGDALWFNVDNAPDTAGGAVAAYYLYRPLGEDVDPTNKRIVTS